MLRAAISVGLLAVLAYLVLYDFHDTTFRVQSRDTWVNWDGQQSCKPAVVVQPSSIQEVQNVVRKAAEEGKKVHVAGSGHSFSPCVCTNDYLINLDKLNGLLSISENRVTVEAGIRLYHLNELLALHGLRMKNLGHISEQSLAGVISTGTHGTGIRYGSISTLVEALQIVLANGSVVTASRTENVELFNAARVSFGSLGVIVTVTLQCPNAVPMRRIEYFVKTKDIINSIKTLVEEKEHVIIWHLLQTDVGRITLLDYPNITSPTILSKQRSPVVKFFDEIVSLKVFSVFMYISSLFPQYLPIFNSKLVANLLPSHLEIVDRSDRILNSGYPAVYTEMEYFFELDKGIEAYKEVLALSLEEEEIGGLRLPKITSNLPIVLRFVAKDDIYLSTQYGRDSLVLSLSVFRNQEVMRRASAHVERIAAKYGGRPHWGKMHNLSAKQLRPLYPMFDKFVSLRNELDPKRVFVNDYVNHVLLEQ